MTQKIEESVWDDFQTALEIEKIQKERKARTENSGQPSTSWMKKVCEKVQISNLASESGIERCPFCNYDLYFNDSRGWFCCVTERFNRKKCFSGNIVDFAKFIEERNG